MLTPIVIAAVVGYLLGSLPFGYLVARAKGVNIFEVGSKNPGATNVRRVLGHGPGNVVLALDIAKGALAVVLAYLHVSWTAKDLSITWEYASHTEALGPPLAALVGALLGHSFSCFTGFRGGKGVATGAGGVAVLFPPGAGIALVVWAVTAGLTRYVSLASMLAAISLPVSAFVLHRSPVLSGVSVAVALFVVVRHRANLARLLAGTENRLGQKKPDETKS